MESKCTVRRWLIVVVGRKKRGKFPNMAVPQHGVNT